jgi:ACR3 family arsenite efflux pump ArsB
LIINPTGFHCARQLFKLGIAAAAAVFRMNSSPAFMAGIGPLVEAAVTVGLVDAACWFQSR